MSTEDQKAILPEKNTTANGLRPATRLWFRRAAGLGAAAIAILALLGLLGYLPAKLDLERGGFAPSHPRARFIEDIEKHGAVKGLEYAWKRHDGVTIVVRESARAIRDARGKPGGDAE